jgi:hypothetical protein
VLAASAHYLHPPTPGPVTVEATLLRGGRSASQLRTQLRQDGRVCVEALVTTSTLAEGTTPYWDGGVPSTAVTPFDASERVPGAAPGGIPAPIMDQVEARIDPADTGFLRGAPSGRGELRGWLALPGGEPFDPVALLYALDAFPPSTFEIEPSGWVPTLELTGYVRALRGRWTSAVWCGTAPAGWLRRAPSWPASGWADRRVAAWISRSSPAPTRTAGRC